jgi:hypothetical protein
MTCAIPGGKQQSAKRTHSAPPARLRVCPSSPLFHDLVVYVARPLIVDARACFCLSWSACFREGQLKTCNRTPVFPVSRFTFRLSYMHVCGSTCPNPASYNTACSARRRTRLYLYFSRTIIRSGLRSRPDRLSTRLFHIRVPLVGEHVYV